MKYTGDYSSGSSYNKGDVAFYTDGIAYMAIKDAPAGATPHEEMYWARLLQPLQEMVEMFHDMFDGINSAVSTIAASIPQNISDEAITLKGSEDAEYLITVDDSGDTPELAVTLIETEEEGDDT